MSADPLDSKLLHFAHPGGPNRTRRRWLGRFAQAASALSIPGLGIALSGALVGCGGQVDEVQVPFTSLIPDAYRLIPRGTYVLRSTAEWKALWESSPAEFAFDPFPARPKVLPEVDFQRQTLLVISLDLGIRCNMPEVLSVTRVGDTIQVQWRTNEDTGASTSACLHRFPLFTLTLIPVSTLGVFFTK